MEETERKERRLKRFLWIPIVLIILLVGLLSFIVAVRLFTPEDTWICQNGEWVEHGKPRAEKPTLECKKDEASNSQSTPKSNSTTGTDLTKINPVDETHDAVNSLPNQSPIGAIQIKGFFGFMAPVVDIAADFGAKVCEWGRPPEVANNCPSIKVEFQEFFTSQTK
jgi:hypothetical protein